MYIYKIRDNRTNTLKEVSEQEFFAIMGTEEIRSYINQVYKKEISIEDVPEDVRHDVQMAVDKNIEYFGTYEEQLIPGDEFLNKVEEIL